MENPMRNLILSILSLLALLMYPLSLSAQNSFSLSLDVNDTAGDQAITSLNASADQIVAIQIFGKDIQNANGLAARFEYDASQVTYEGFDVGDVLPNAQALPEQGTGFVEIGIASLGGQATTNSGLVGTVRFRTTAGFSGTAIRLVRAELSRGGQFETVNLNIRIALQLQALTSDFDGDGMVNFADFLAFAGQFGTRQGDGRYEAKYDLDSDGAIGFGDFLIFSSSFGKGGPSSGGGSTLIVDIPDANLRAVIADSLGKASGASISRREIASVTVLEVPNSNIRDLTGLEFATRLTRLNLDMEGLSNSNRIYDLSPLSSLTNLTSLELSFTGLTDISALGHLTSLTTLWLRHNLISDISPLANLTNLEELHLRDNLISDISPLANLTNLEALDLVSNNISDVSALAGLTNLIGLDLSSNNISDVSALAGLTNLIVLVLGENAISDVSTLAGLTRLERLDLSSNNISDVSALAGLTNLIMLGLDSNNISNVAILANLTNLIYLALGNNAISDVSALAGLNYLTGLGLSRNTISDISVLSDLTGLKWLYLDYNTIVDISPLVANTGLGSEGRVDLRGNPLSATSINTHIPALQGRGVDVIFGASKPAVGENERGLFTPHLPADTTP
ncbi:MAG: hypothetical protein F4Z86_13655 [Gemmatimonadetes bacterium]|nr:hypothetical protein [Gemmatimonadota bacterium]MYB58447.1 hypothetical protein [Gemmatimonadota bacterium]